MPGRRRSSRRLSTWQRIHAVLGPRPSVLQREGRDVAAELAAWRAWDAAHGFDWRAQRGIVGIRDDVARLELGERAELGVVAPDPPGLDGLG